jgi:hypothetical protein
MNPTRENEKIIRPEDVSAKDASKVLAFLNSVKTAEEIAEVVEIAGERDVGIKVAQNILETREQLGGFTTLAQVADTPQVGTDRFTSIVTTLRRRKEVAPAVIEPERVQFRALILQNPNYFGNVEISPFKPVKPITSNTSYEEVTCVGLNPEFDRLEAVVLIKRESGYGGDVCSNGTPEYVRFYMDWNNDGNWDDLGMTSFIAQDIPGNKPLEYAVTLQIDSKKKFCFIENLPKVRAILSWNNPPPPNTPGFLPVWGNALDAHVQIDALKLILISELLGLIKAELPKPLLQSLELAQPLQAKPKELNIAELKELYQDTNVTASRFGFSEVQKLMAKPASLEALMAPDFKGPLSELAIDVSDLIDIGKLFPVDGDTHYEELKCVGLDPNLDTLTGVVTVKQPSGYSGGLCTAGSREYVAFWVDWLDGAGWTYAGTTSVNVHDIAHIPPEDLQYAVFLPIDLTTHRQPCWKGPKLAKVRAILSWQVPPLPGNPNYVPTWGNREETLVHIKPGHTTIPGDHRPFIETVGNMGVDDISGATGQATGAGVLAAFTANDSPFGGWITITGRIGDPPDTFGGGATALKYKVYVRRAGVGDPWQPLTNPFTVKVTEWVGGIPSGPTDVAQSADVDGWYTYLEDYKGNEQRFLVVDVLARWPAGGLANGLYEIRMDAKDPATNTVYPGTQVIRVLLDNEAPKAELTVTGFSRGGGPIQPAAECGKFQVGDIIYGKYTATDEHFNFFTLTVQPAAHAGGATPNPLGPTSYPVVPTWGVANHNWSLDTTGMDPCGYTVRLGVRDRTIVNSGFIGRYNEDFIGFCLEAPSN